MLQTLQVGKVLIPYELRRSASARERRITITPGKVEVLALASDDDEAITGFLTRKRQWVFDTVREMEVSTFSRHKVPSFMTGSTIPYRGRQAKLTVRRTDDERLRVTYRNGFLIDVPTWARDAPELVAAELKLWLKAAARRAARDTAKLLASRHDVTHKPLRVAEFEHGWGSCGPKGHILINWQLVFAPPTVLAYVVAHELAHLRVRGHGPAFWTEVENLMPDYRRAKSWLDANASKLSADWLDTSV